MSLQTAVAPPSASQSRDDGAAVFAAQLAAVAATCLAFLLLRDGTDFISEHEQNLVFLWAGIVAALALGFAWIKTSDLPRVGRRFAKASATFLLLYAAIEPFDIPYAAIAAGEPATIFHHHGRLAAIVFAIAGFWRLSGVFASAMCVWMVRDLHTPITGFYFSNLDIRNVVETMSFAVIGMALAQTAARSARLRDTLRLDDRTVAALALTLIAIAIGGHLANYVYSAGAKLALDGGPLSWIFGNRLDLGVPVAIEKGTYPFTAWPWASQLVHDVLKVINPLVIPISFLVQASPLAAWVRRRWVILVTILFDAFHVIVYLAFGLLFWKWMALNTVILATLAVVSDEDWRRFGRLPCLAMIVAAPLFFKVATLAWYDETNFASGYFEAELDDGTRMRIPNAYFGSSSYQVSQHRLYWPGGEGHFNHSIWASYTNAADARAARDCRPPDRIEPAPAKYGPPEALERYVAAHHEKVLRREADGDRWNYYLIPHHHMPSPFVADPFYGVDKRRVSAYVHVTESVCLGLDDGRLTRRVLKRTETPVWTKAQ